MTCEDWRDAPSGEMQQLYHRERERWAQALHWNYQPSCDIIETARAAGRLPGWLVRDASGVPQGWTFYLLYDGVLQIGGLAALTSAAVRVLLNAVLDSPEAGMAQQISALIFPERSSLASALARRRFVTQNHLYLQRRLDDQVMTPEWTASTKVPDPSSALKGWLRPWRERDAVAVVRLLAAAYGQAPVVRCFAPHGRLDEWARYVGQLLRTPACGQLLPGACFVVEHLETGRLMGAILTTLISPATAHIVQVAVDPEARGFRIGQSLVSAACAAAHANGCERMTLLVVEDNHAARALYSRQEFEETARFVYGSRGAIRAGLPASRFQGEAQSPGDTRSACSLPSQ